MRFSLLSVMVMMVGMPTFVIAQDTSLTCQNPGREYNVIYQEGASELVIDPDSTATKMRILVDEKDDQRHVVTVETVEGGPTGRLHLRPYLKLEYWTDGEIMQTDGCYKVR